MQIAKAKEFSNYLHSFRFTGWGEFKPHDHAQNLDTIIEMENIQMADDEMMVTFTEMNYHFHNDSHIPKLLSIIRSVTPISKRRIRLILLAKRSLCIGVGTILFSIITISIVPYAVHFGSIFYIIGIMGTSSSILIMMQTIFLSLTEINLNEIIKHKDIPILTTSNPLFIKNKETL